jgi:UDP-galactopyranose mutase
MKTDILIIGAGITGITLAERFASEGKNVLIIEKRNHIGGNCYDYYNEHGILVHKYGPHIFHTNYEDVWNYLSNFTDWIYYQHKVLGNIDGKLVPIPFNLNTVYELFPKKYAEKLEKKLIKQFGYGKRIPILDLKNVDDEDLKYLADFIYEKVFLNYTVKQWGLKPEEIDKSVTARVPIVISRDDRYFNDKYQGMPKEGYTKMFEKMLNNRNIKILLNTDYKEVIDWIDYDLMIYTGEIDYFFNYKYGKLPYRCLNFEFKTFDEDYQPVAVVNYNNNYDFTRITDFKKMTFQEHKKTTICMEYPSNVGVVAYPILNEENKRILSKYMEEVNKLKDERIYFIGRLAGYKYYNMDETVKKALELYYKLKGE